jgi:hypothetical protein
MTSANANDSFASSDWARVGERDPAAARELESSSAASSTHARDLGAFRDALLGGGLISALRFLNQRTSHRFTGVFRFDGDMLRSVALVDKWLPGVERGDDVPLAQAYCAHLKRTGEPLEVEDGATDPRTPWMRQSPVVSYCGSVIRDAAGSPWGALCHFDTAYCQARATELPLLVDASALIFELAAKLA